MRKPKLKPCPFCGQTPTVIALQQANSRYARIGCVNQDCPVQVRVGTWRKSGEAAKKAVIDAWNTRKSSRKVRRK